MYGLCAWHVFLKYAPRHAPGNKYIDRIYSTAGAAQLQNELVAAECAEIKYNLSTNKIIILIIHCQW